MPADPRYAPLPAELSDERATVTKELEVYRDAKPPPEYTIDTEVDGLDRFADEQGFDRFHLYGYSAGGAIAIAYVCRRGDRVASLAIDEPASDFTDDDRVTLGEIPDDFAGFVASQVKPGVEMRPPPTQASAEMAKRPAGVAAFTAALRAHRIDHDASPQDLDGCGLAGGGTPIA